MDVRRQNLGYDSLLAAITIQRNKHREYTNGSIIQVLKEYDRIKAHRGKSIRKSDTGRWKGPYKCSRLPPCNGKCSTKSV